MQFESADDRKKIDKLLEAFETFCVGSVNEVADAFETVKLCSARH